MSKPIRVRIAPSPSGFLHIGTAKMALFNWVFARKRGGTFILRLEDTDASRTEEQFVQGMLEGFRWLGINWDEGPQFGDEPQKGDHGPYRQSLRKDAYRRAVDKLLGNGAAYKCFASPEEVEEMRRAAREEKRPGPHNTTWRDASPEETEAMGDAPYVVRFRVPEGETVVDDVLQGEVRFNHREIDDFVIQRSNGDPMFHLAVVVDDGEMGVSHVIRGDDHLTNCARHVMLFNALEYDLPAFAHLPMVLDENGKKYSKRLRGANVLDWREDGYLPEALVNYMALLGWTPPDDEKQVFTRDELVAEFSLERLSKSAAKFDRKKLQWLNGQHIRMLPPETLRDRLLPLLERAGFDVDSKTGPWLTDMARICQEKLRTLNDIVELTDFFFVEPQEYEEKAVKKRWRKEGAAEKLVEVRDAMAGLDEWTHDALKGIFESLAAQAETGLGQYIHPVRLALTGKSVGPGLFELAELLGKETCLRRMGTALEYVESLRA